MTTRYCERVITPHHTGFGMWQASTERPSDSDLWDDAQELLAEMCASIGDGDDLYELGKDDLPEGVEDIRGNVHNQPSRVFAIRHEGGRISYHGIDEIEA